MRIVSLLPSATEIVCLVGAGGSLVGRSHECDWPASVGGLPVLTGQRTRGGSAAEIDAQVRAGLAEGGSLYTLDAGLLARLEPDLIITQDVCEVCSIDLATVRGVAAGLPGRPEVLSLNPTTVEGVLDDVLAVGRAAGRERAAREAVVRLRERMYAAQEHVAPFEDGVNVAFLEWTDPVFSGGHWTPQLIERAGGRHPLNPTVAAEGSGAAMGPQQSFRRAGKSVRVPAEVLAASGPEALIVSPCGLDLASTRRAVSEIEGSSWWRGLPAVRSGRVALVDGNQMFNRPGPRLVDALEWLVGWLQGRPEVIPASFPWEPWRG